jgi:hypothetical protein
MTHADHAFRSARAALDRCAWTIESLRARTGGANQAGTRWQCLALHGVLYDLDKHRDHLRALHAAMAACPAHAFADRWCAFRAAYDDFLEAARAGRMELDRIGCRDPVAPPCDECMRRQSRLRPGQ